MSTAQEILVKQEMTKPWLQREVLHHLLHEKMVALEFRYFARECGARSARKHRKRGDDVRYHGRTRTGKARYRWMPRFEV
jgi:hypothetical protein